MTSQNKHRVLSTLNNTFKTTNQIAEESGLNWYVVFGVLQELMAEKIVEKIEISNTTSWRLKNE